ncbi:hypothetical protein N7490_008434 [Penicillium lividum]|nr:hypothetical protein N7490_008434 [Penicillium lividum]
MKATVIATLLSVLAAASAVPSSGYKTVALNGNQLKSALAKDASFDVNQFINCTVAYTLTLSTAGPPYTIDLASLDLSNCTYA